ncbi:MAG TPA: isocitrate lyase/PEP mutase family protein [Polyangiaceae bacterium]|nr:isocitrate lyase/PEP mutase family protein [Polyangiaceae bacterium]
MKSTNPMADKLRALLAAPQGIELPGCYDVLSAMILERAGFPAVFMSGYGIAASMLGNPDIGLTSLVETALMTKNVSGAIRVPLVVDADNGYGDEDSVVRTVYELERAGAAAIILEDQVFPKRCGHAAGKSVIPLDRYLRKLDCALEARQTSMVVVARTDATSMDEGIVRAKRFHAAGADVTLIDGLPSVEALRRIGEEVPGHKVINLIHGGKTPLLPSQQLHDLGFKIVLYSTPALYTAARTMLDAMTKLAATKELGSISDESMTFRDFQGLIESQYFQRRGADGLARVASGTAPVSHMRLQAVAFEPEERKTGTGSRGR